jgi:uncharacterized membrane protein YoaK (UPF0700 family)
LSIETSRHTILATIFMAIAGFVDAVGFLTLSGLFASFMSGNSTQFALSLGRGDWAAAWPAGALVGLFLVGVIFGRLIAAAGPWSRPLTLLLEAVLLFASMASTLPALARGALMAIAMGMQNEIVPPHGEGRVSLTYVTGTLVNVGERFADALRGAAPFAACLSYSALWLGLIAGGAAGAATFGIIGTPALAIPAGVILMLALAELCSVVNQRASYCRRGR